MRVLAVLIVALVFASTALLAEPATAQSSLTLTGRVCAQSSYYPRPASDAADAASECQYTQGLPDASVSLTRSGTLPVGPAPLGPSQVSATTDANGDYRLDGLASGDYTFSVTRTGFETASKSITLGSSSRQDAALSGQSVQAAGQVVDGSGKAVAGADVVLCCSSTGEARATTGADGRFSVTVTAGHLSLSVQAPGFQPFYESRLVDGASSITLSLTAIPPQDAKIAGTVRDQDGNAVAGARVAASNYGGCYGYADGDVRTMDASSGEATPTSSSGSGTSIAYPCSSPAYSGENYTFSDAQGRFLIGAYSGFNTLSVSKEGYAYASLSLQVQSGQTASQDVKLLRFPEKTALLEGRIVDGATGKGVRNAYLNVQSPEYGLYECSQSASASGSGSPGSTGAEPAPDIAIAPGEPYPGCAITVQDDGTFSGLVSPGYAIVSVWVDWYSSCSATRDADGSSRSDCGPEYYAWSTSQVLPADATTRIDVRLRSRPAPDAVVSGYVLDGDTGQAIPGAQVSFSNQDNYGWGSATTDQDGSYAIRLRSGYHSVSVWAEGHLRWEGVVDIAKGDTPFDITLQPGQESYGSCCYAYAEDGDKISSGAATTQAPSASVDGLDGNDQGVQYEDLGGGLGPYDAAQRQAQLDEPSDGAPGIGLLAVLAALGAVLALRRRPA